MDQSRYTELFLADSRENLNRAAALLLDWERAPESTEPVAELFRSFHSVKGAAATMGYAVVADLAHSAEHLLEAVRQGELAPSKAVLGLLIRAVDVLEHGVEAAVNGADVPDAPALTEALARMVESGGPTVATAPPEKPAAPGLGVAVRRQSNRAVRVEPARLDDLLHRAGELMVAYNRLEAFLAPAGSADIDAASAQVGSLVRSMHSSVLHARLAPITELFNRFPRVVRDLGQTLGRVVRLETRGEGIEMDRGVLEELVDPLVHLIRNAVDHGIEAVPDRLRAGKPSEGRLTLTAERLRDWVAVHLTDDGRGIDAARVTERAHVLGLLPEWASLANDEALLAMLSRPGFSLKGQVTEVSGRGVGMDVVASTVRTLGGRVTLRTQVGVGTAFTLLVPMTTAIQRVLLVGAEGERYAIPFRLLAEATRFDSITADQTTGTVSLRDGELPFVDLAGWVSGRIEPNSLNRQRPLLVLAWGSRKGALAVDTLLGQFDVVIERVEAPVGLPAWVSGATILADGSPAFVLDPTALFLTGASHG